MKRMIKTGLFIAMLTFAFFAATAQENNNPVPKWVSDKGYWVVEGNVKAPLDHTIRFYNNDDVLVYKESLTGMKLDTNKRKVKMKLKKALESAITAWESKKGKMEEMALVKNIL